MTQRSLRSEVGQGVAKVIGLQLAFTLALLFVVAVGGGFYALTSDLKSKQDIIGARISAEISTISSALEGLANSPVLWTALTDTTDRNAYLAPLLAGLNRTDTFRFGVLDYRGREYLVPDDFFLTEHEYQKSHTTWLEGPQLHFEVIQNESSGLHVLMVAPIVSPMSRSVVGYAIGAYGIDRSLMQLQFGLETAIKVNFRRPAALGTYDFGLLTVSTTSRQTINTPNGEFVFYLTVTDSFQQQLLTLILLLCAVALVGLYARRLGLAWSTGFAKRTLARLETLVTQSRSVVRGESVSLQSEQASDEISEIQNTLVKLLTDQRTTLDQLKTAASVYETAGEAIMVTDVKGVVVDVNTALLSITGYTREQIIGQQSGKIYRAPTQDSADQTIAQTIAQTGRWRGETVFFDCEGHSIPVQLAVSVVHDSEGKETGRVAIFTDIRQIKHAEERLRQLAYEDPLTGKPNYRAFTDFIVQQINDPATENKPFLFLFIDLDRLKQINDLWGHEKGDDIIQAAADHFSECLPHGHLLGRRSGDEFLAYVPVDASQSLQMLREQLRADLVKYRVMLDDNLYEATASIGVTQYPQFGQSLKDLLQQADAALYEAKRAVSGSKIVWYDDRLGQKMKRQLVIQAALPEAIRAGRIVPHFQPEVSLATGRVVGFEALARWYDPVLGFVAPDEFIAVAEESDLIVSLSHSMLDQVFAAMPQLQAKFAGAQIAVNVSPRQFLNQKLLSSLKRFAADHPDFVSSLVLEITETDLSNQEELLIAQLQQIRELGLKVAIDDFGKGHSSLSRLANMPLDKLKIDAAFVAGIGDGVQENIIEVILGLAHTLGLTVTAEGVETEQQRKWLHAAGCQRAQGWLYARAMRLEDALALNSPMKGHD
ncbi:putative bifunctional diguanylate cyclase/phosphodiesterase [Orrella daihaiensis]|uniref:EAL domain-containing protein n=1 Tax=Orrella daihaiensis TaxID=2782176 RepID=A0ABY4AJ12_9BURK|nr:GGDEF domain-containing phosphodiesterase [Orrella daihaiensis]UOD50280.1 EAL domain-containing protein [Orrella daihaiensis]